MGRSVVRPSCSTVTRRQYAGDLEAVADSERCSAPWGRVRPAPVRSPFARREGTVGTPGNLLRQRADAECRSPMAGHATAAGECLGRVGAGRRCRREQGRRRNGQLPCGCAHCLLLCLPGSVPLDAVTGSYARDGGLVARESCLVRPEPGVGSASRRSSELARSRPPPGGVMPGHGDAGGHPSPTSAVRVALHPREETTPRDSPGPDPSPVGRPGSWRVVRWTVWRSTGERR